MKKLLFTTLALFILNLGYSQTIINVSNITEINDTLDYFSFNGGLINQTTIQLNNGNYDGNIIIPDFLTSLGSELIITSLSGDASLVTIGNVSGNIINIQDGFVTIKNISIKAIDGNAIVLTISDQGAKNIPDNGNILIDSCIIFGDNINSWTSCVYTDDISVSSPIVDNISFTNNTFIGGAFGIDILPMYAIFSNITIKNNTFENQMYKSINIISGGYGNNNNIEILNNDIKLPVSEYYSDPSVGIYLGYATNDTNTGNGYTKISGNKIHSLDVDTSKFVGIYIKYCNGINDQFIISNNFIDIHNTDSLVEAIEIEASNGISVLHNTISISGPNTIGFENNNGGTKAGEDLIFRNNIIISDYLAVYSVYDFGGITTFIDNNCYFTQDPVNAFKIGVDFMDFNTWKSQTNIDANSLFTDPMLSPLHDAHFNNLMLDNVAPAIPDVSVDIDGLTRNTSLCDIGAKEQVFVNLGNDTLLCYNEMFYLSAPMSISYLWNTGETTQNISITTAGDYSVTVQEIVGGPIGIDTISISYKNEIVVQLVDSKTPTCFGDNNGYLEVNATGGLMPYSYYWAGLADTNRIENLAAGTFYVDITDADNCFTDTFFVLNQPEEIQISFVSPPFCGGCTGFIIPTITGGIEPYGYVWSSGTTDSIAFDLCAGSYTLTIIDDSLCINTGTYDIIESGLAYISGTLSYSGGNVPENDAKVELYKYYIDGASELEYVDENIITTGGKFEFTGVEPEEFYIRSMITSTNSIYSNIYTSYYSSLTETTLWPEATSISLQCEDTIDINFLVYEVSIPLTGPGVFSGTITYNSGGTKTMGEPVPGGEVFVEQEPNQEPISNTQTGSDGGWTIEDIPAGTGYNIIVDIPGMPLISTYQNLSVTTSDTVNADLNFFVDTLAGGGIYTDTTTAIIEVNSTEITILTYPNPVTNYLNIETELNNKTNISYSIVDINGRKIISKELGNIQGKFTEKIDMNNYINGVYFIKLKLDNSFYIRKIIKK